MTPTALRSSRLPLLTAALAGLALSVGWQRPATESPGEPPMLCLDGWSVPDLVRHLEARGLGLCAVPTPRKGGPLGRNAFLAPPGKTIDELDGLIKDPAYIARWRGVVYCEEYLRADARNLEGEWGDCFLLAGPFVFFGDRELLSRIRDALRENPSGEGSRSGTVPPGHQCITKPPSTLTVWPVTFAARAEARKTARAATSSGSCQRPRGTTRRIFSSAQTS
jgi:hypothetical protein